LAAAVAEAIPSHSLLSRPCCQATTKPYYSANYSNRTRSCQSAAPAAAADEWAAAMVAAPALAGSAGDGC